MFVSFIFDQILLAEHFQYAIGRLPFSHSILLDALSLFNQNFKNKKFFSAVYLRGMVGQREVFPPQLVSLNVSKLFIGGNISAMLGPDIKIFQIYISAMLGSDIEISAKSWTWPCAKGEAYKLLGTEYLV